MYIYIEHVYIKVRRHMACGQRGYLGRIGIFSPFTMDTVCLTELTNVTWKKPFITIKNQ